MLNEAVEETVAELESDMERLTRRVKYLEQTVEQLRALGEEFWRKEAAIYLLGLRATSWRWSASDPDDIFPGMFPTEVRPDGTILRWLGTSGEIATTIAIYRGRPLVFRLELAHFASPELAQTLRLEVDGKQVPWSSRNGTQWCATIPGNPSEPRLKFRLSVDKDLIPDGKDVSMALRQIRVEPVAPVASGSAHANGEHTVSDGDAGRPSARANGTPAQLADEIGAITLASDERKLAAQGAH